ncbi:MAG: tRNA 2-selenouridine(34) synthase MnmH [Halieaceae bacterium]|jgi:tRNA 2-selenouridine synthase|nr:tRNA 2-selenouridine(34) synthase MnmH [Halieaceae bacterium]
MVSRPDTSNYRELFVSDTPMMDMRAPVEFEQGAFPFARSLPLLSDEERAQVGVEYKERGQDAAIRLGNQLVSGPLREERLAQWCQFAKENSNGYLYCFRGGLRSSTVRQWLHEAGIDYPLVIGGYKAMRQFLLEELERSVERIDLVLIAGKTGTGKTRVIEQLPRSVDLEGLAVHRGSSFGQLLEPQPRQIDFENSLSIALMKLLTGGKQRVYLEDESRLIGRLYLPESLQEKMKAAPMLVVEYGLADRVEVVLEDYIVDLGGRYAGRYGGEGHQLHKERLQQDLFRIRKRLGGERYQDVNTLMSAAFDQQACDGNTSAHRKWIAILLGQYYDPMYEYQLSKRGGDVLYRGAREGIIEWASRAA